MKRWFIPAAARARGQSNDLNREILASNLFNCHKEVINAPPVPSISRCIHIVYRHKNVWEYQWSNFIYNCVSTFLHYVCCKDALLDCSAPGGERCESLTWVDEIKCLKLNRNLPGTNELMYCLERFRVMAWNGFECVVSPVVAWWWIQYIVLFSSRCFVWDLRPFVQVFRRAKGLAEIHCDFFRCLWALLFLLIESMNSSGHAWESVALFTHFGRDVLIHHNRYGVEFLPESIRGAFALLRQDLIFFHFWFRADSRFAPSQWETALLCSDVSYWLGANLQGRF